MPTLIVLAAAAIAVSIPLLWWSVASARTPKLSAGGNLGRGLDSDLRQLVLSRSAGERALEPLGAAIAGLGRRFTPSGLIEALERRFVLAGQPAAWPLDRILAAKLLLGGAGFTFAVARFLLEPTRGHILLAVALTAMGYLLPDLMLLSKARARQEQIRRSLPDTLDQMTVCVEAGLGFEAAMARVGRTGEGPLADEVVRALQEMNVGATRAQALRALASRTDVPELRRFVLALLQAESFGMAIADVLRIQAGELRVKRRQRAEEHAMKIPVKIIFPLVLCILPTLFIAILGPAAIRMARFFAGGMAS